MIKFKLTQLVPNKKHIPIYLFLAISIGLFFLMGYQEVATRGPFSRHAYRQSDSYAFALNYFYTDSKFLEPSILFVLEDKGSKAVSEFPILYFISAKIWTLTGVTPLVPRLMNLVILFLGLFFLYKLSNEILKDHFWALLVSLFMFSSPLLGYYSFNFIPNIPALGLALIASYYYYKYHNTSQIHFLILSTILFSLAALIKISSLFAFIAINAVFLFQNIRQIKKNQKALLIQLSSVIFLFAVIFSWYAFAIDYNSKNLEGLFRQEIIPIWDLSPGRIQKIMETAYTGTVIYFYNPIALIALATLFITSIVVWKKTNKTILLTSIILFLGLVMFILLFFDAMDIHEYFLIDITIIIPAIILTFLTTLKNLSLTLFNSKFARYFSLILLLLVMNYNLAITRIHYDPHNKIVTNNIPLPQRVQKYWNWLYWDWEVNYKCYEGIVPYLRSLGIKFEDKVISIPDETPNVTLTLVNQKGFTDYHYSVNYEGSKSTERKIELGAKYMIVQGEKSLLRDDVAPFIKNQIGEYHGIKIFRLADVE